MKVIQSLILFFFLLISAPLFGQSSKPLGVILPPTIIGNITDSRAQILLNTLDDELSKYFDVSPSPQRDSGELEVVKNIFQLQLVEEEGNTELSLRWISGDKRKVKTDLCGGCKTIELNKRLVGLVGELFGKRIIEKTADIVESPQKGILYISKHNGVWGWHKVEKKKTVGRYDGQISKGVPNGKGTANYSFGDKYIGGWKDGKLNGQGTYIYSNGNKYIGEYKNGKINGQGTFIWSDGAKYIGEWKDNKENGWGKMILANGLSYEGEYKNGSMSGQGTFSHPDGTKMVGEFKGGTLLNGTLTSPELRFDGKFNNGQPWSGRISQTTSKGLKFDGVLKNGKPWNGTLTDKKGKVIKKYAEGVEQK